MNAYRFSLAGATLEFRPSGALHWPDAGLLCISDLHLGRSERYARRAGALLPPYEVTDTLTRLEAEIEATGAGTIVSLGDSFDDLDAAGGLEEEARLWITRLAAGRQWIWVEGNHDPGPVDLPGTHLGSYAAGPLTFRHIAEPGSAPGEISGHYHPKARISARGRSLSRPSLVHDAVRAILPAFGTYTGGLRCDDAAIAALMGDGARAVLTGQVVRPIPYLRG